ncbi:MAG: hypothetical protein HQ514_02005 [Rhodospirillales bacterium]|nr:hypothetical protein [Rhodospirillales bacterium]
MNALIGEADGDGGIPDSALLARFAEAAISDDGGDLSAIRTELVGALGEAALIDASAIVATFNAIDRVADSTGIPIDEIRIAPTSDLREQLGINAFPSRGT